MLDQAAFANSIETQLQSLNDEEVQALVLRSVKRMDGAHRSQFALFLGHDVGGDPIDEVGGSPLREQQLREYINSSTLLRERFAAFLRENPRAAVVLGIGDTQKAGISPLRKITPKTAAIAIGALMLAFLPLAAQYAHQKGIVSGLGQVSLAPILPAVTHVQPAKTKPAVPRLSAKPKPKPSMLAATRATATHRVIRHARRHAAAPVRIAQRRASPVAAWKFDPRFNPYFNRARWHIAYREPRGVGPPDAFAHRARLVVEGYLSDVVSGNTAGALQHLGLPAGADLANVREVPIVTPSSRVHVVAVARQPDGRTKVEADINGPSGEYFEVFYVSHDGPAARIVDRYYIPVNRTAEERAARLLAKDGRN
jgi:hypothetical protein